MDVPKRGLVIRAMTAAEGAAFLAAERGVRSDVIAIDEAHGEPPTVNGNTRAAMTVRMLPANDEKRARKAAGIRGRKAAKRFRKAQREA